MLPQPGPIRRLWRRLFWRATPQHSTPLEQEQAERIRSLESSLDASQRALEVQRAENKLLAELLARDLQRVKAETAEASRRVADAER